MGEFGIGQPVPREEDPYLVRGAGRYVDDVQAIGQARAYVLRSPHAHAAIVRTDTTEARAKPGVLLVLTGDDAEVLRLELLRPHTVQMPATAEKVWRALREGAVDCR
jgi:CO/xanthine dehydrogenase Mo-binding subunit